LAAAGGGSFIQESDDDDDDELPSFLQVRSRSAAKMREAEWQSQAADYLMSEGNRIGSWVLSQVGSHLQGDPFGKVKGMIAEMIEKLVAEQAEEASHKAWCDQELTKSVKSQKSKDAKIEDLSTRIEKAESASAKLSEQIKTIAGELAEMDDSDAQATTMRQKEHAEFVIKRDDLMGALKATQTAIKVLQDYYSGKSLLQTKTPSDSSSMSSLMQENTDAEQPKGSAAASIIGLIEVAESDFSKALSEAQAAEGLAQDEYETMIQDNKVSRAEKQMDQKNKNAENGRLKNLISETKLDHKDASDELAAVVEYLDKLKGDCETKAPSFEERQKRRKQEMDGLQNAMAIMSGQAIAFMQGSGIDQSFARSQGLASVASLLRR